MSAEDYATREQTAYESFEEYFGIKLADLKQDENGNFIMSEQQRETFVKNILGRHMCSLQWISWKDFGSVTISLDSDKIIHVKGTYNFTVAGQRRYWRMQEMTNPDDPCCDYVDIYFDYSGLI